MQSNTIAFLGNLVPNPNDYEKAPRAIDDEATYKDSMVIVRLSDIQPQLADGNSDLALPLELKPCFDEPDLDVHSEFKALVQEEKELVIKEGAVKGLIDPQEVQTLTRDSKSLKTALSANVIDEASFENDYIIAHLRSSSSESLSSAGSAHVDWETLDKNELQEQNDEGSDGSTALLLARLEQANNALATDPKAGISKTRARSRTRPPSIQQIRKLVNESTRSSLRYSLLSSPPPMTELEFWSALVSNYPQTAQRLPTLTSNKIRGGVPPPLRGVVWTSIAGARDSRLEDDYDRLCGESSPYGKLIGKDIGRSFPGVDMFRDPNGEGQKMLGKVLNAFSLWDREIGYCQGLGFVVGPLLMHMEDKEAFCVLVRLMQHYDLRSCFLPDLSGLHLRIFQFQRLLSEYLPKLTQHLERLKLEPLYLSQWFLSFFGVTCPLPMLLRIYDVILTEGASETLMRVALSLMRRNETKIMATSEFEDIMQLLLSRGLWDTYSCNADDLIHDFCELTGLVTRERLESLETRFKEGQIDGSVSFISSTPNIHSAASRFLGRFWAGSNQTLKANTTSTTLSAPSRPLSSLRRTPSKQSMASTLNSVDSSESNPSAPSTEATNMSRQPSADWNPSKQPTNLIGNLKTVRVTLSNKDKDLHIQIEELLTALSDMQRERSVLVGELQKEREDRDEDRAVVQRSIDRLRKKNTLTVIPGDVMGQEIETKALSPDLWESILDLEGHFAVHINKRSSISQTKHQLQDELARIKQQYNDEALRSSELLQQLTEREREASQVKELLRDARSRVQESHRDKQRLEKTVQGLKNQKSTAVETGLDASSLASSEPVATPTGLRELRLGRPTTTLGMQPSPIFSKRISSLNTQSLLATEDHRPVAEDTLLQQLVAVKLSEVEARQELEEVKRKLELLRKVVNGGPSSPGYSVGHQRQSPSLKGPQDLPKLGTTGMPSAGGILGSIGSIGSWGKRSVSTSTPNSNVSMGGT